MSLSISISNDDGKPFLPGSPVLGVVKLVTYDDQAIGELSITFRGRASVLLIHSYGDMTTSRKDYQSVGYLFSQHLNLYQGKYTHRKGSYMWPFAFCIPLSAAPRAVAPNSADFFHAEHPWKNDRPLGSHPLPPSMSHGGRFHCSITYTLEATLAQPARTPLSLNRNLTANKDVKVQPLPSQIDWDPGDDWPYTNYRHKFQCSIKDMSEISPQGLLSQLGDGLRGTKSNDRKRLEICISVRVPKKALLTEQPMSLIMSASARSVAKDRQPENVSLGSQLVIREFKISLWQHTHVRAGRHHSSSTRRVLVRKSSCRRVVSETPSLGSCQGGGDGNAHIQSDEVTATNLTDGADLSLPTSILVPDFSTYNIARSHSLEMSFKMQYVNKKFRFRLGSIPIRLLPAKWTPSAGLRDMQSPTAPVSESELRDGWMVFSPGEGLDIDDDVANVLLEEPPPQYRV